MLTGNRRCGPPRTLPFVIALGLLLAACASGPQFADGRRAGYNPGHPSYKIGAPYQVNGVWYTPKVDYDYDVTGTASWYGEAFDGQLTANGEIFDLNQLTAAHKTLPLPSVVQVTNLQNGRSIELRVNDRGPYVDGRVIDVSRRAAQLLGFETSGTAPVRVRILREESIQVAQAAMRGETGSVRLAETPQTVPVAPLPRATSAPMPSRAAPDTRIAEAQPPPMPRYERVPGMRYEPQTLSAIPQSRRQAPLATVPLAEPASSEPIRQEAAAQPSHRSWPGLISQAHADTLRASPEIAAAKPIPATGSGRIFVQAGAFAVAENAQRVRQRIARLGSVEIVPTAGRATPLYRVRLGPFTSEAEANRLRGKVIDSGFPDARVVSD